MTVDEAVTALQDRMGDPNGEEFDADMCIDALQEAERTLLPLLPEEEGHDLLEFNDALTQADGAVDVALPAGAIHVHEVVRDGVRCLPVSRGRLEVMRSGIDSYDTASDTYPAYCLTGGGLMIVPPGATGGTEVYVHYTGTPPALTTGGDFTMPEIRHEQLVSYAQGVLFRIRGPEFAQQSRAIIGDVLTILGGKGEDEDV